MKIKISLKENRKLTNDEKVWLRSVNRIINKQFKDKTIIDFIPPVFSKKRNFLLPDEKIK